MSDGEHRDTDGDDAGDDNAPAAAGQDDAGAFAGPPPGQAPYGQPPGHVPHGQPPPGQAPYGQPPHGHMPYGQPYGQAPYGQAPPNYGYGQPNYYGAAGPMGAVPGMGMKRNESNAVVALIIGILSLPLSFCCGAFSLPVGIAAVVFGFLSLNKINDQPDVLDGRGMAIAGIICGGLAILLAIAMVIMMVAFNVSAPTPGPGPMGP